LDKDNAYFEEIPFRKWNGTTELNYIEKINKSKLWKTKTMGGEFLKD